VAVAVLVDVVVDIVVVVTVVVTTIGGTRRSKADESLRVELSFLRGRPLLCTTTTWKSMVAMLSVMVANLFGSYAS
jgi:hypothetical protein